MMNKIIFTIVWGCLVGLFVACEEENPGYLFSDQAAYPEDSLVVLTPASLKQSIADMKKAKEDFQSTEEGRKLYEQITELETRKDAEMFILYGEDREPYSYNDGLELTLDDLSWNLNYGDDYLPIKDEAYFAYEAVKTVFDSISGIVWDIDYMYIPDIEEQIKSNIGNIDTEIVLFQRRLDNKVAYTSSSIDQLQGTAPLIYSIAAVKAEGEGDAEKFADYLSVMGSGRFLISWDDDIPVGRYVISLYVENEGWKNLLADVFTVIVK